MLKKTKAQSLGEYAIVISIVLAFMAAMYPMVKRGTQSLLKVTADQIGSQKFSDQSFNAQTGYTDFVNTSVKGFSETEETLNTGWYRIMATKSYDLTDMQTNTETNMGFTEEEK